MVSPINWNSDENSCHWPSVIAHRGGSEENLANTLHNFRENMRASVDAIEFDVQVTIDGSVLVYHPRKLSQGMHLPPNTPDSISRNDVAFIQSLCRPIATQQSSRCSNANEFRIPTLEEVLNVTRPFPLVIDLKSATSEPLIEALAQRIPANDYNRIIFYSTEDGHIEELRRIIPHALTFERRDDTFSRLLELSPFNFQNSSFLNICESTSLSSRCYNPQGHTFTPSQNSWLGLEWRYQANRNPIFVSGEQNLSGVKTDWSPWDENSTHQIRLMTTSAHMVMFGVNSYQEYVEAARLGASAVYSDEPIRLIAEISNSQIQ